MHIDTLCHSFFYLSLSLSFLYTLPPSLSIFLSLSLSLSLYLSIYLPDIRILVIRSLHEDQNKEI